MGLGALSGTELDYAWKSIEVDYRWSFSDLRGKLGKKGYLKIGILSANVHSMGNVNCLLSEYTVQTSTPPFCRFTDTALSRNKTSVSLE